MSDYPKLAFIGTGNMARAILGGLLSDGYPAENIWATGRNLDKLSDLAQLGVNTGSDNQAAVAACDVVVLAVKPQMMREVISPFAETCREHKPLFISVAAGIPAASLDSWLGGQQAVVRCMPNTPSLVKLGASGLFANAAVSAEQREITDHIMAATGLALWVEEEQQLNAVTAVSGSGPAYYFLFMEAMIKAGIEQGLSPDVAAALTLQTARGAAEMAVQSCQDPAELRRQVTSPNGTTERAINSFEADGLADIVARAMQANADRAVELSEQLG